MVADTRGVAASRPVTRDMVERALPGRSSEMVVPEIVPVGVAINRRHGQVGPTPPSKVRFKSGKLMSSFFPFRASVSLCCLLFSPRRFVVRLLLLLDSSPDRPWRL